jgi:hypothetical protein
MLRTERWISVSIILALAPFMISGSAATTAVVNSQTTQAFSKCTDPTGQNLQCILTTSKLPPPIHTLLCQESSGQIFKCNYVIETLKNGLHVVVMTVYVPANFIIKGTESFQVINLRVSIHTTYGCQAGYHIIIIAGIHQCVPDQSNPTPPTCPLGNMTHCPYPPKCGDSLVFNNFTGKCEENGNPPTPQCPDGLVMDNFTSKCIKNPYTTPTAGNNNITGNSSALAGRHSGKTGGNNNLTQEILPLSPSPPTSSCPDGLQPDSSGNCPNNQLSPNPQNPNGNNNNNPPSNNPPADNNPPPSSNPPPGGNDNNNDNNGGNPSSAPSSGENDNNKDNGGSSSDSGNHKAD